MGYFFRFEKKYPHMTTTLPIPGQGLPADLAGIPHHCARFPRHLPHYRSRAFGHRSDCAGVVAFSPYARRSGRSVCARAVAAAATRSSAALGGLPRSAAKKLQTYSSRVVVGKVQILRALPSCHDHNNCLIRKSQFNFVSMAKHSGFELTRPSQPDANKVIIINMLEKLVRMQRSHSKCIPLPTSGLQTRKPQGLWQVR